MHPIYFIIGLGVAFVIFSIWAVRFQKKRVKRLEDFFAAPAIVALLESGFQKDVNGIYGRIDHYDVGLYVWIEPGGNRYFTYLNCEIPGGISEAMKFGRKYRDSERIEKDGVSTIRQELKQIDGDTLAQSFARLHEVAIQEKFVPTTPRPSGQLHEF